MSCSRISIVWRVMCHLTFWLTIIVYYITVCVCVVTVYSSGVYCDWWLLFKSVNYMASIRLYRSSAMVVCTMSCAGSWLQTLYIIFHTLWTQTWRLDEKKKLERVHEVFLFFPAKNFQVVKVFFIVYPVVLWWSIHIMTISWTLHFFICYNHCCKYIHTFIWPTSLYVLCPGLDGKREMHKIFCISNNFTSCCRVGDLCIGNCILA